MLKSQVILMLIHQLYDLKRLRISSHNLYFLNSDIENFIFLCSISMDECLDPFCYKGFHSFIRPIFINQSAVLIILQMFLGTNQLFIALKLSVYCIASIWTAKKLALFISFIIFWGALLKQLLVSYKIIISII